MNNFSKFKGCNRLFCIKPWGSSFKEGVVYNCEVIDGSFGIPQLRIQIDVGYVVFYENVEHHNIILKSFHTISEHRKFLIEELL